MRKYNILPLLGLAMLTLGLGSCDTLRTSEQDAEAVSSPDGNPVITFTPNITGNELTELDTFIYTLTLDKMLDRAITVSGELVDGTVTDDDYEIVPVTIQPYSKTADLMIIFHDDGVVGTTPKTASFEFAIESLAERYLVNPSQVFPTLDLTINNPSVLIITFDWSSTDDIDIVTWSDTETNPLTEWGDAGATTAQPEIDESLWLTDPVGTYYVNIMDWGSDPFDYTFSLLFPNGSVQTITGTFDRTVNTYTNDRWTAWGGSYSSYRVLKVVNNGTSFTVTKL